MSQRVASGFVDLSLNDSTFKAGLTNVEGQFSAALTRIEGAFGKLNFATMDGQFKSIATSVQQAGAAAEGAHGGFLNLHTILSNIVSLGATVVLFDMFNVIRSGIGEIVKTDAMFQVTRDSLTKLLGSAPAANAFFSTLQQGALKLPFTFAQITQSAQEMVAVGFDPNKVMPFIKAIGDGLSATGRLTDNNLQLAANAFDKIQMYGHVTLGVLTQLNKDGVPATKALALGLGVTEAAAVDMVHKGLVPAAQGEEAMRAGLEKLYGGMGQTVIQDFTGALTNLKDRIMLLADTAGRPIFDFFVKALNDVAQLAGDSGFTAVVTALGSAIGGFLSGALTIAENAVHAFGQAWNAIGPYIMAAFDVIGQIGGIIGGWIGSMFAWGQGLVSSFADGMASAVSFIISVINQIGAIIGSFFETHSPPKILPKMDIWGKETMEVWLKGATTADFSILDKIRDSVHDVLDSIAKTGGMNQKDVIPTVIGTEAAMTKLIDQLNQTGTVTQTAMDAVVAAAGPAGASMRGLIEAEIDVEEKSRALAAAQDTLTTATTAVDQAQDHLKQVTADYDALLAPLKDKIDGVTEAENALTEAQQQQRLDTTIANAPLDREKAKLEIIKEQAAYNATATKLNDDIAKQQDIINDKHASAADKAQAAYQLQLDQAELRIAQIDDQEKVAQLDQQSKDTTTEKLAVLGKEKLTLQDQQKTLQDQKTAAEKVAQAQLDAAKKEQDAATERVKKAQTVLNIAKDLLKQHEDSTAELVKQNDLLNAQEKLLAGTGGAGGAKGGGGGGKLGGLGGGIGGAGGGGVLGGLANAATTISDAGKSIEGARVNIVRFFSDVLATINTSPLGPLINDIAIAIGLLGETVGRVVGDIQTGNWGNVFRDLFRGFTMLQIPFGDIALRIGNGMIAVATKLWDWVAPQVPVVLKALGDFFGTVITWVGQQIGPIGTALLGWGAALWGWVAPMIPPALKALGDFIGSVFDWIGKQAKPILDQLGKWKDQFIAWVGPMVQPALKALGDFLGSVLDWIGKQGKPILDQLGVWKDQFLAWAGGVWDAISPKLGEMFGKFVTWVGEQAPRVLDTLGQWKDSFVTWATTLWDQISPGLGTMKDSFFQWVADRAKDIGDQLGTWAKQFGDWAPGAVKDFLLKAPDIIQSILDWIDKQSGPIFDKLGTWATQFADFIAPHIPEILAGIAILVGLIELALIRTAITLFLHMGKMVVDFYGWIVGTVIPKIPGWIGEIAKAIAKDSVQIGEAIGTEAKKWPMKFWVWVSDVVAGADKELGKIWKAIGAWIATTAMNLETEVGKWPMKFWTWVVTTTNGVDAEVNKIWQRILTWLGTTASNIETEVGKWPMKFWMWVVTTVGQVDGEVDKIWKKIQAWLVTTADNIKVAVLKWVDKFFAFVAEFVLEAPANFLTMWDKITFEIGNIATKAFEAAKDIGIQIITGIVHAISGAAYLIGNAIQNAIPKQINLPFGVTIGGGGGGNGGTGGASGNFADGGVVPGAYYGQEVPITAHAGEVYHGLRGQYGPTLHDLLSNTMQFGANRPAIPTFGAGGLTSAGAQKSYTFHNTFNEVMLRPDQINTAQERLMFLRTGE